MPRFLIRCLAIAILLACIPGSTAAGQAADFYVAPDGNDGWSGTHAAPQDDRMDGPFATIVRAQAAVRGLQAAQPDRSRPIVVMVREGTYHLTKPLVFSPEDSGTLQAPVVFRAYPGERPVISGGRRLEDWTVDAEQHWHTRLPEVEIGTWEFSQLFVDDQRRFRPRVPREGYFYIDEERAPTAAADSLNGDDRFRYAPGSIKTDWDNRDQLELLAFHSWSASRLRIRSIDGEERLVTFTGPTWTNKPYGRLQEDHRYLITNVREALDEPGEWYLDETNGSLTYIPGGGETPDTSTVIAPRLNELVRIEGDVQRREWVEHIHFRGLTFAHSSWNLPPEGQSIPQAEVGLGGAVNVVGGRHLVIDSCVVRNVGGYALSFGEGSKYNQVSHSEFVDLGAGGIKIGHAGNGSWEAIGRRPVDSEAAVSHHTVTNNTIAHGGRLHPAGVGIWIGHASHNRVEHNEIFDFYYTGVSVGWNWGYDRSPAHHNKILYNHIHTIGQNVLSDMSGVYTLGVSPGTEVSHNRIHDIRSYDYGGWGLYTDEGSSYITMANNLVYRTRTGGFHQHYGRENRIVNNIFAFSVVQQLQRTRAEDHRSFTFARNIVYYDRGTLLGGNWGGDRYRLDHNIYWRSDGEPVRFPGQRSLETWRSERGHDLHSIVADPEFEAPEDGRFQLGPGSPAEKIGFEPFDYSEAGRSEVKVLTEDLPPVPAGFESSRSK